MLAVIADVHVVVMSFGTFDKCLPAPFGVLKHSIKPFLWCAAFLCLVVEFALNPVIHEYFLNVATLCHLFDEPERACGVEI